ncbi:MAG: hypothetical protein ING29_12925 [Azospirillum sp.]|nr:hypothetical protein [Azospirillum sp.]
MAADLDASRRVARLEKIATNEAEHPARRARAYDEIYMAWRKAALATPIKAAVFWERARVAAVTAETLRPNACALIAGRLEAIAKGQPMPEIEPDPDYRGDPNSPASRELRQRLDRLVAGHLP